MHTQMIYMKPFRYSLSIPIVLINTISLVATLNFKLRLATAAMVLCRYAMVSHDHTHKHTRNLPAGLSDVIVSFGFRHTFV